ncbi:MAG: CIS tube protein [Chitinophagaceae bacterium]
MADATLKKLLIRGYSKPDCTGNSVGSIEAVINPETYSRNLGVKYIASKEIGASAKTQRFASMESSEFELDLIVDGTGVVPLGKWETVDAYIMEFEKVIYKYQGIIHEPNYLKLTWGGELYIGVCKKLSIRYTLFRPDGTALRASIKMTVLETVGFRTKFKEAERSSPDLTHIRTVKAGDNLPLMTYRIYGDSSYYMEVAKANGFNSFLAIKPGDQIYFPPIKK